MIDIATPVWVTPAYADPDAVWGLVTRTAPHPLMWSLAGYGPIARERTEPWFRSNWALDGTAADHDTTRLLHHPPFVDAAKVLFDADVVRPASLIVNLMGPMAAGGAHLDTPTFRGFRRSEIPVWLLLAMGASGLFAPWSVRVAGALTWFYDRDDGAFEYWPRGLGHPSECVHGPFANHALVADNDRMPHRVRDIGQHETFASSVVVPVSSQLEWREDAGWAITTGATTVATLAAEEVRVSILWKALVFADDAEADTFDSHSDDLDIGIVVDRFRTDLRERGIVVPESEDPLTDEAWSICLNETYRPGPDRR